VTVTKIQLTAYSIDKQKLSVSAGAIPDLEQSTAFFHYYGFRYEFRIAKFDPTTLVFITIYTIDRTNNQVRTLGYSMINLFLNKYSTEPCTNPKDRDYILHEGNYQLPIYIQDPRELPELRLDRAQYCEKVPAASILVRIHKAPLGPNNEVLSTRTVP